MPGRLRPWPVYLTVLGAGMLGVGSLLLLGAFLLTGPFGWVDLRLGPVGVALWSLLLSLAFCVQHSGMVRRSFRRRLARAVDPRFHGALYASASGLALLGLLVLWQESTLVVVQLQGTARLVMRLSFAAAVGGLAWAAWSLRGFDLLGIEPPLRGLSGRAGRQPRFVVRGPYRWVRHPLYTLTLVMLWSYPDLTLDRLLLDGVWTVWIVVGSRLEERDLIDTFGDDYRRYRRSVPMLIPWRGLHTPSR